MKGLSLVVWIEEREPQSVRMWHEKSDCWFKYMGL